MSYVQSEHLERLLIGCRQPDSKVRFSEQVHACDRKTWEKSLEGFQAGGRVVTARMVGSLVSYLGYM